MLRRETVLIFSSLALLSGPAFADLRLSEKGSVAFLESNRLDRGDAQTFEEFIEKPRPHPIRIVYLDSRGGRTQVAIAIGRLIRKHRLDTAFRPARDRCVSACTTIFLGGLHRFYIGGGSIQDGIATHKGLGFHPSGVARGEESIRRYYDDMGVHNALTLRYKVFSKDAPSRQPLFFSGGDTALRAGVATNLSEPADPTLRD